MTKTTTEVVNSALRLLNVIGSGESADADIFADASAIYTAAHAKLMRELQDKHRITRSWDANSVPDEAFAYVSRYLARELIGSVPASPERAATVAALGGSAPSDLAKLYSRRMSTYDRFPEVPFGKRERSYR